MNASEHQTANHDESCEGESPDAVRSNESPDRARIQEFSWYGGRVDERVLRVILDLGRAPKQ
jgi:hypothetical protein